MAHINLSKAHSAVEFKEFVGIDRSSTHLGEGSISDIVNFRVMPDGTLKKRSGFSQKLEVKPNLRAYYEISDQNYLIIIGNRLYMLKTEDYSLTSLATLNTSNGNACFFCYDGRPFLLDGDQLYFYQDSALYIAEGYAPLYGKNWHPINAGAVNEQVNLLSEHIRISYRVDQSSPELFTFNLPISSIDAVYIDGIRHAVSNFSLSENGYFATANLSLESGSEVLFYLTLDSSASKRSSLTSCTGAAIYGSKEGGSRADVSSIFFYGGANKAKVFCTRRIAEDAFAKSNLIYPSSLNIYVSAHDALTLGDGTHGVTAACRRGNGLLVFTENEAYALTETSLSSSVALISSSAGCSSENCALPLKDSPVTVTHMGILKWSPSNYSESEYIAQSISSPIDSLLSDEFHLNATAYLYRKYNEMWFADRSSENGRVFIYNIVNDRWYCFEGIYATSFLEICGRPAFFDGKQLCIFESSASYDEYTDGNVFIEARIESSIINFGSFADFKRLISLGVRASKGKGIHAIITDARGVQIPLSLSDASGEIYGYIEQRTVCPRSRYYSFTLISSEADADEIYGITLVTAD